MICPICKKGDTSVVDSRPTEDGTTIRRRRLCICGQRFTTFERVQFRELMVVKKNGRKSPFDRDKLSKYLTNFGIGNRAVYSSLSSQPFHKIWKTSTPVTDWIATRGLQVPAQADLLDYDINEVCMVIIRNNRVLRYGS